MTEHTGYPWPVKILYYDDGLEFKEVVAPAPEIWDDLFLVTFEEDAVQ